MQELTRSVLPEVGIIRGMILPRFRLRTIFILVAVFAVASWAFWIGWPSWIAYQQQLQFLDGVKRLHVGMTETEVQEGILLPGLFTLGDTFAVNRDDAKRDVIYWSQYQWPGTIYVVCTQCSREINSGQVQRVNDSAATDLAEGLISGIPAPPERCVAVAVYKLPQHSSNYVAATASGNRAVLSIDSNSSPAYMVANYAYINDLLEVVFGNTKDELSFSYELVYSDPPK